MISYSIYRETDTDTFSTEKWIHPKTGILLRECRVKHKKLLCSGGPNDKQYLSIAQLDERGILMTREQKHGYAIYNRRDSYFGKEASLLVWFPPEKLSKKA